MYCDFFTKLEAAATRTAHTGAIQLFLMDLLLVGLISTGVNTTL